MLSRYRITALPRAHYSSYQITPPENPPKCQRRWHASAAMHGAPSSPPTSSLTLRRTQTPHIAHTAQNPKPTHHWRLPMPARAIPHHIMDTYAQNTNGMAYRRRPTVIAAFGCLHASPSQQPYPSTNPVHVLVLGSNCRSRSVG